MAVEDEYTRLLKRLLPPGPAWEGNNPLLEGLAPSLARATNLTKTTFAYHAAGAAEGQASWIAVGY